MRAAKRRVWPPFRVTIVAGLVFGPNWLGAWAAQQGTPLVEERPKLVVGIVIDQMKFEYLPRFWGKFGESGFKRLVGDGYLFANHHYDYVPTYTAPGHASIYTGTTPAVHGIVANDWYDRTANKLVSAVEDASVQTVGADDAAGRVSPKNLLSTTVTDELKRLTPQAKVVALSIKDRSAILPGGHLADYAFWYDSGTGGFVTSTWYMDELPQWVRTFNERKLAHEYSRAVWEPLLPIGEYTESDEDDAPWEDPFDDERAAVFPHRMNGSLVRIITSPFGNELLGAFAKAAVQALKLGEDDTPDFLAISFSSPDYVGHRFGPRSVEIQDIYLRLDRELAGLLSFLDEEVGEGNYLVFLTADHGVVEFPQSLRQRGLPGGKFDNARMVQQLQQHLAQKYGEGEWISRYVNQQVYLNRELIAQRELSLTSVQNEIATLLRIFEGVVATNTSHNYATMAYSAGLESFYQRGFFFGRSGDVFVHLGSGWLDSVEPTSHGSPYNYDTHVPLVFYGWRIPRGKTSRRTVTPEIAPTVSWILGIPFPSGSEGRILTFE